jgi:DNA end-binding protein Ku
MARAMWKGVIRVGSEAIPVKMYSAVEDRGVGFRLLAQKGKTPVRQRMVNPETDEPVPYDQIRRGYETEDGAFVILDESDLEELEPDASREIEITRALDPAVINHQWYDRPYYLGPDGAAEAYASLVRALAEEGAEAVARWAMRKKEYRGALRSTGQHLMLVTLRSAEEVVAASSLPRPQGRKLDARELKMAEQLIEALAGDFDPAQYRDEYRDRVLEFVAKKAKGGTVEVKKFRPKKPKQKSLAELLEASVESAGRRKGRAA